MVHRLRLTAAAVAAAERILGMVEAEGGLADEDANNHRHPGRQIIANSLPVCVLKRTNNRLQSLFTVLLCGFVFPFDG